MTSAPPAMTSSSRRAAASDLPASLCDRPRDSHRTEARGSRGACPARLLHAGGPNVPVDRRYGYRSQWPGRARIARTGWIAADRRASKTCRAATAFHPTVRRSSRNVPIVGRRDKSVGAKPRIVRCLRPGRRRSRGAGSRSSVAWATVRRAVGKRRVLSDGEGTGGTRSVGRIDSAASRSADFSASPSAHPGGAR